MKPMNKRLSMILSFVMLFGQPVIANPITTTVPSEIVIVEGAVEELDEEKATDEVEEMVDETDEEITSSDEAEGEEDAVEEEGQMTLDESEEIPEVVGGALDLASIAEKETIYIEDDGYRVKGSTEVVAFDHIITGSGNVNLEVLTSKALTFKGADLGEGKITGGSLTFENAELIVSAIHSEGNITVIDSNITVAEGMRAEGEFLIHSKTKPMNVVAGWDIDANGPVTLVSEGIGDLTVAAENITSTVATVMINNGALMTIVTDGISAKAPVSIVNTAGELTLEVANDIISTMVSTTLTNQGGELSVKVGGAILGATQVNIFGEGERTTVEVGKALQGSSAVAVVNKQGDMRVAATEVVSNKDMIVLRNEGDSLNVEITED